MDHNETCKGSCEREKWEIDKIAEANIESDGSEQEEGEIRELDEPPRLESPVQKGTAAIVEQDQVHIRQSASPQRASRKAISFTIQRASHKGSTHLQQQSVFGAIHKDMSASTVHSVQDVIEKEQVNIRSSTSPERGSYQRRIPCIIFVQQSKCSAIQEDMAATPSTSSQGVVEDDPSTSAERGSRNRETASTAVVQQSKYTASEGRHVDVRQSTSQRICRNHRRSYSPSAYSSSKERHKKKKERCFRYSDSCWVLKMIEEVCSQRFNALLSRQNGDRKKFNFVRKKQESEFFQKHVHSYKVHHAHVMPTISYCRMMLPKLHFSSLRDRFHKHMKSQLLKFVKQQVSDRNKENRIKERWIFEAKAGYLKKLFYATSLSYSEFKLEKLECHMTNYSDREEHLKYFDMQSLTTKIEAIASNKEPEGIFASDVTEPIQEHSPLLPVTNGATKLGFSVGLSEERATLESSSSQLTYAPGMEFGENDGTQIAFSAAAQNEGQNMESPCASRFVTGSTSELAIAVSNDTENAAPVYREKRRRISSGNVSEGPCCMSGRKFGEKDGTQIALSPEAQTEERDMEKSCASHSDKDASLELAMPANTDSENTLPGFNEKQTGISSDNNISEVPCSGSQIKFPYKPTSNLCRTTLHQEESSATRPPLPLLNNSQMIQPEDTGGEEVPSGQISSFAQVTDQPNMHSNTQSVMNQHHCGSTSQVASRPYQAPGGNTHSARTEVDSLTDQPNMHSNTRSVMNQHHCGSTSQVASRPYQAPGGNTHSARTGVDSLTDRPNMHSNTRSVMNQHHCGSTSQVASRPYQAPGGNTHSARTEVDRLGASDVPASNTHLPIGSTPRQFMAEDGPESNLFTIELSRLQKLHDLIAKRHQEKTEQLILARQVEMAQAKKKYDEQVYNSEVEVLERRRELKITCDKIYKQQILAEVLQVIYEASTKVVQDSPRGAAEPNRSSDQRSFQFTAPVSAPASASIYQSPQSSVQASTDASLRQHHVTAQHTYVDSSGRSTANLMNYPSGGMGLAYRRQA